MTSVICPFSPAGRLIRGGGRKRALNAFMRYPEVR
jgi:hypothetical protein